MAYQTQAPQRPTLFSYSEQMAKSPYPLPVNQVSNVRPPAPVSAVPQITYGFSGRELIIPVINLPTPTVGTFPLEKASVYLFARAFSSSSGGSQPQQQGSKNQGKQNR